MPGKILIRGCGAICAAGPDLKQIITTLFAEPRTPAPSPRLRLELKADHPVFAVNHHILDSGDSDSGLPLTHILARIAAVEALSDAGYDQPGQLKGKKVGVCFGTTVGATLNNEKFYRQLKAGTQPALTPLKTHLKINPADWLAREFSLTGPRLTVTNACTSSADAIAIAADWIKSGLCDLALAGGSDELSRITSTGFASLLITDPNPCRPFDRQRAGLNLGEGAAFVVLEKGEPGNRGSRAVLAGTASCADAWHLTAPHPEGRGLKRALDLVLEGYELSDLAFVHCHGTGTSNNDLTEGLVLREKLPGLPFFSTKRHTGHTLGAAGALAAVITISLLNNHRIPASAGFSQSDPAIAVAPTTRAQSIDAPLALSQSLGFGGNNTVLLFQKSEVGR